MPKVAFKEHEVRAWLEIPANARRLTDEESLDLSYRKMRYHRSTEYWQDVYLWQREIAPDAPDMRLLHLGIIPRWSWREHGVLRAPGNDERFDGTCYYQAKRTLSVATQKSPLVAIVRLLVRGQMGQFLLPEEQVLPVSARPSRGRGLGNRRQVLHEWGPLAGHQWGFLHGHVHLCAAIGSVSHGSSLGAASASTDA